MLISDFDYPLPPEHIAQTPLGDRAASKLLVDRGSRPPEHRAVDELARLLRPGDVVVVNDTRVLPARLLATRPSGGRAEVLLLAPDGPAAAALASATSTWEVLVRPSKKIAPGTTLIIDDELDLSVTIEDDLGEGRRRATITSTDLHAALQRVGVMPLPPYITEPLDDPDRYQTVYAARPGSAAAPTAGLHLTEELLAQLCATGISFATVELVVGLDTFRPVTVDDLADHVMHSERYHVPPETKSLIGDAERVVAIGTTTVRALESDARFGPDGSTDLFIAAPFEFRVVDLLMTNFHMPRSTLLVMIDAFVGDRWRALYETALERDYRFLSFGDAMLLDRHAQ